MEKKKIILEFTMEALFECKPEKDRLKCEYEVLPLTVISGNIFQFTYTTLLKYTPSLREKNAAIPRMQSLKMS